MDSNRWIYGNDALLSIIFFNCIYSVLIYHTKKFFMMMFASLKTSKMYLNCYFYYFSLTLRSMRSSNNNIFKNMIKCSYKATLLYVAGVLQQPV